MKKTIQGFLSSTIFLVLLIFLLSGVCRLVEYKESREKIQPFIDRADQFDVLFFGDSHAYSGIYPMDRAIEAFDALANNKGDLAKLLIRIGE